MPENPEHVLAPMVRQLGLREPLTADDRNAILALPFTLREVKAGQYLVWDGDKPQNTCLLISGFAIRHKLAGNGGRQIVSMLTNGEIALIPVDALRELAFNHPSVGMAMWYETLVEGSIFREWVLNIGRRDARTRISHLLCELALRMEGAGLGEHINYELPITQEQLADAVALTSVHVNRTLMKLQEDGLITRNRRMITVLDWKKMMNEADFEPRYLHIRDRAPPPAARAGDGHDAVANAATGHGPI